MLYDRVASLVIGQEGKKGVEIRDLRFTFSIEKGATENPNKCSCKIYNLAPDTRALVENVNNVLILKAGYKQDLGEVMIFAGTVTRSITRREGADWITEIEMSDSLIEYRDTKTSFSFAPGISAQAVLTNIASTFGLPLRQLPSDIARKTYPEGFAFVGRSREAMAKACDYLGLEWSLQNREVQILKKGQPFKEKAFLLSPDTGMIGSPEQESKTMTEKAAAKKGYTEGQKGVRSTFGEDVAQTGTKTKKLEISGYKVRSLLLPTAQPGGYVCVESKSLKKEFFRIETLVHVGDTHANDWHTELTLRYV